MIRWSFLFPGELAQALPRPKITVFSSGIKSGPRSTLLPFFWTDDSRRDEDEKQSLDGRDRGG